MQNEFFEFGSLTKVVYMSMWLNEPCGAAGNHQVEANECTTPIEDSTCSQTETCDKDCKLYFGASAKGIWDSLQCVCHYNCWNELISISITISVHLLSALEV